MLRMILALAALTPCLVLADPVPVNILRVVDGDTLDIEIPADTQGWNEHRIRLIGINTPEHRSRCDTDEERAKERQMSARAENYVRDRVMEAELIEVERNGQDGFNRALAVLWLDGRSLNRDLLEEGWALPYRPGTHGRQWCGDAQNDTYPTG